MYQLNSSSSRLHWCITTFLLLITFKKVHLSDNIENCIVIDPIKSDTFIHKNPYQRTVCIHIKSIPHDHWMYAFSSLILDLNSINGNSYVLSRSDCRKSSKSFFTSFLGSYAKSWIFQTDFVNNSLHRFNPYQVDNTPICLYLEFDHFGVDINVKYNLQSVNIHYILGLLFGYALIRFAPSISRKQIFVYVLGVIIGFFFSFAIVIFFMYGVFKKNNIFSLLAGGTALLSSGMGLAFLIKYLFASFHMYPQIFFIYACVTTLVSLATVYYYEPFGNEKILNMSQWFTQFIGVLILLYCSNLWKISFIITFIILTHIFSLLKIIKKIFKQIIYTICFWFSSLCNIASYYRNRFRKIPYRPVSEKKFLTMDEYNEEGILYTKKALNDLRQTILSHPKNIQFAKILSRPMRYIEFAAGGDHITEEEKSEHASWLLDSLMCDDNEPLSQSVSYSYNRSSHMSQLMCDSSTSSDDSLLRVGDDP